jgi:hypothetical protein
MDDSDYDDSNNSQAQKLQPHPTLHPLIQRRPPSHLDYYSVKKTEITDRLALSRCAEFEGIHVDTDSRNLYVFFFFSFLSLFSFTNVLFLHLDYMYRDYNNGERPPHCTHNHPLSGRPPLTLSRHVASNKTKK